jgi:hypothetical protein
VAEWEAVRDPVAEVWAQGAEQGAAGRAQVAAQGSGGVAWVPPVDLPLVEVALSLGNG